MQHESHAQDVHQIFHIALRTLVVTVTVSDKSNLVKVLLIKTDMSSYCSNICLQNHFLLCHLLTSGVFYCVLTKLIKAWIDFI